MSLLSKSPNTQKNGGFRQYTCLKKCLLNLFLSSCQVMEVGIHLLFNKEHSKEMVLDCNFLNPHDNESCNNGNNNK